MRPIAFVSIFLIVIIHLEKDFNALRITKKRNYGRFRMSPLGGFTNDYIQNKISPLKETAPS